MEALLSISGREGASGSVVAIETRQTTASFWRLLLFVMLGPVVIGLLGNAPWYFAPVGSAWLGLGLWVGARLRLSRQDRFLEAILAQALDDVRLRAAG